MLHTEPLSFFIFLFLSFYLFSFSLPSFLIHPSLLYTFFNVSNLNLQQSFAATFRTVTDIWFTRKREKKNERDCKHCKTCGFDESLAEQRIASVDNAECRLFFLAFPPPPPPPFSPPSLSHTPLIK